MSHDTLMTFADELWPAPGHRSHPCHNHMTSDHIPCGQHHTPTFSFPNLGYNPILCFPFMYTLHHLHLCYPQPVAVSSAPYIRPPFMYVFVISNINLIFHCLLDSCS